MRFLLHVQQRIPQSCCHALCCLVSFCWNARPEFVGIFTFIDAYIYTKERDLSYLTSLCEVGISALQVLIRIRACFGRCAPMSRGHRRKIMKSGGSSFVSIGVTQGAAPKMYIIRIIFKHPPTRNRFCMQHAIPARWFIAKVFWKSPSIIDSPGKLSARALRRRAQSIWSAWRDVLEKCERDSNKYKFLPKAFHARTVF